MAGAAPVIRPAVPADFARIELRPEQAFARPSLLDCASSPVIVAGAYTALRPGPDTVLAIAGIVPRWPGHGTAWAYISDTICGREWVHVTGAVRLHVDAALDGAYHRIELWCHADPPAWAQIARRWAEKLGFQHEGLARQFDPERRDVHIYSRVRDG